MCGNFSQHFSVISSTDSRRYASDATITSIPNHLLQRKSISSSVRRIRLWWKESRRQYPRNGIFLHEFGQHKRLGSHLSRQTRSLYRSIWSVQTDHRRTVDYDNQFGESVSAFGNGARSSGIFADDDIGRSIDASNQTSTVLFHSSWWIRVQCFGSHRRGCRFIV